MKYVTKAESVRNYDCGFVAYANVVNESNGSASRIKGVESVFGHYRSLLLDMKRNNLIGFHDEHCKYEVYNESKGDGDHLELKKYLFPKTKCENCDIIMDLYPKCTRMCGKKKFRNLYENFGGYVRIKCNCYRFYCIDCFKCDLYAMYGDGHEENNNPMVKCMKCNTKITAILFCGKSSTLYLTSVHYMDLNHELNELEKNENKSTQLIIEKENKK